MNKLLSALAAGLLVLAMNGFVVAQDEPQMTPRDTQQDTQIPPDKAGDLSEKEQDYFVALTKCESLGGSQKTKCIEAAKKKFGQL